MEQLDERFLVISGDVLTDIDLGAIVDFHDERGAMATIGLAHVENPLEFGIVITREDGRIERFLEKPTWGQVFSDTINTGIFVLEPEIFDYIEADRPVDFSSEVFPKLLAGDLPLYGAIADGYWEDVGTLDSYVRAHKDILDGAVEVNIPGFELSDGVWLGEGAEIHPEALINGPAVIGDNCRIEARSSIGQYTVLGANVRVRSDAQLERTVVNDNAYLGEAVRLRGTVVGRACDLRKGVRSEEGVVIGDECFIGEDALLSAEVKIYPFKTVEAGATVNTSIVWESRGARALFGRDGIVGLANVDITPEFATKVAMAYGSMLKKGTRVITSRDSSRSARMLKRSMMAGLNAAGVNVEDLEVASVPVTRFIVRRPVERRWHHHPPRPRRPAVGDHPLLRRPRPRHHRGHAAQDRAAVQPGGLPPGVPRRDRRHRLRAPGARALRHRPRRHRRRRADPGRRRSRSSSTTPTGRRRSPCPTCWPSSGLEVLAVNPFVSTAGRDARRPRPGTRPTWPTWCGPRARTSVPSSTPTASG